LQEVKVVNIVNQEPDQATMIINSYTEEGYSLHTVLNTTQDKKMRTLCVVLVRDR
jgi:hypothetical protein